MRALVCCRQEEKELGTPGIEEEAGGGAPAGLSNDC
jgi:hypothetical protein